MTINKVLDVCNFVIMVINIIICTLIPSQLHSPHLAGCGGCWAGGIEGEADRDLEREGRWKERNMIFETA